jgi:hypothetical protein
MTSWHGSFRAAALVLLVAPTLTVLWPACVEPRFIGSDPADAGADRGEDGAPPGSDTGCPEGQVSKMGVCTDEGPACSMDQLDGGCPDGQSCEMGECLKVEVCGVTNPDGSCPSGKVCEMGTCIATTKCSAMAPDSGCSTGELCTPAGICQVDPCLMNPCTELVCCATLSMGDYVATCVMGMMCP